MRTESFALGREAGIQNSLANAADAEQSRLDRFRAHQIELVRRMTEIM